MKHLTDYVYEGLFDVADMSAEQVGKELADELLLSNKDSEFWWYVNGGDDPNERAHSGYFMKKTFEQSEYNINKKTVNIPGQVCIMNSDNPLAEKYDLTCDSFSIGLPSGHGPHPGPIKDCAGFSSITVNNNTTGKYVSIDGFCKDVEGLKLYLYGTAGGNVYSKVVISFGDDLKFKNSSINFITETGILNYNSLGDFPDLKGLKTNADFLNLYDPSFFDRDGVKKKLDKFFGNGEFETSKMGVKKKNIRNIVAASNNLVKYGAIDPTTIIPVGKVSDLLDLSGCKEVSKINMSNNNVEIIFTKDASKIDSYAKYTRIQGLAKYKDYTMDQMNEICEQCKTPDGWYVQVLKKFY